MSTSSSSATETIGQCVVCGKETATRCSACAKNGTEWMFFCSIEHQKLIWKVHRFVCGPRSKPFRWPGLSQEEIDDFLEIALQPFVRMISVAIMQPTGGLDGFKAEIEHLKDPGLDKIPAFRTNHGYAQLRELLVSLQDAVDKVTGNSTLEHHIELMTKRPFNMILSKIATSPLPELVYRSEFDSWSTGFLHRYLISFSLAAISMREKRTDVLDYVAYTGLELERYLKEVISVTHPKEARLLLEWIREGSE
ncbi:hypothetical protein JCM5353_003200 [Sporobolomyces roseus]